MHARRWQIAISLILTIGVVILAYFNREVIVDSFLLLGTAKPAWLLLAFVIELASFFVASQVYQRVLSSLGYHLSALRLWGTAMVAIVMSQSFPAGGVASYAFLVQSFRRRGIPSGHSALLASLEALSYAAAMLLLFFFSLIYIALNSGIGAAEGAIAAAVVGVLAIVIVSFVLTRDEAQLKSWLLAIQRRLARVFRREWGDEGINKIIDDLGRGRALIAARRSELLWLVLIQIGALIGHSLAMLVVLYSLGEGTSVFVVMSAFGIALVSSTFNVLPGGGGTVETAVVLALKSLGVGDQAIPAAVIFRILNFWLMMPLAALCYRWLMHGGTPGTPALREADEAAAHE